MNRAAIVREIRQNWAAIVANAGTHYTPFPSVKAEILGTSHKVKLGESVRVLTAIAYLSPSTESGRNNCAGASPDCIRLCLKESGRLTFQGQSRLWKTALWYGNRELFLALLRCEISAHIKRSRGRRMACAVRLDGTSDLGIADLVAAEFPRVTFYDYTKIAGRMRAYLDGKLAPNRHLTWSFSGINRAKTVAFLARGACASVVYDTRKGTALPTSWEGFPTIDGDDTDVRFRDPSGHVVALRFKASARRQDKINAAGEFIARA